jgi:hypothetical protein
VPSWRSSALETTEGKAMFSMPLESAMVTSKVRVRVFSCGGMMRNICAPDCRHSNSTCSPSGSHTTCSSWQMTWPTPSSTLSSMSVTSRVLLRHLSQAAQQQVYHRKRQAQIDMQNAAGVARRQAEGAVVGQVGKTGEKVTVGQLLDRHQCDFELVAQIASHRAGQIARKAFMQLTHAAQLLFAQQPRLVQVPGLDQRSSGGAVVRRGVTARSAK